MEAQVHLLRVSPAAPDGGDTFAIVPNAKGMSDQEMQEVASSHDHMGGFAFPAPAGSDYDYEIRFWSPYYELEMCTHATIGTVWLLSELGMAEDNVRILTKSRLVEARITRLQTIQTAQRMVSGLKYPNRHVQPWMIDMLVPGFPIQNAGTSKVKTLIPLKSVEMLDSLELDHRPVKRILGKIKSTGLYFHVIVDHNLQEYEARQFPRNVAYWEDAATALAFGLLVNGVIHKTDQILKIRQSWARHPCEINLRFRKWGGDVDGCWIGGTAKFETEQRETGETKASEADTEQVLERHGVVLL
ncbi:unnamed protein product [Penicillium glandicola]